MRRFFIMPALIVALSSAIWAYEKINTKADEPAETQVEPLTEGITQEEIIVIVDETEETTEEMTEETKAYTDEELEILAHLICGEAQAYSDELQLAVGSVVLNRVASSSYPNTIKEVVFQRGQYACTWDGNYNRTPTERNWANAQYLLENGSQLPANVVYQAQFRQGSGVYKKIGSEYFCYK